jgi:hypothetical protein
MKNRETRRLQPLKKAAAAEFQAALALASAYRPARDGLKRVGA